MEKDQAEPKLPEWAASLRRRYRAGEAIQFILHANVLDLQPLDAEYVDLRRFLHEGLLKQTRDVVLFYNLSQGITFAEPKMRETFLRKLEVSRAARGLAGPPDELPHAPDVALPLIEEFLLATGHRSAVVIDYVETVVPRAEVSFLSGDDRANLIALQRWSADPRLLRSDNVVLLITEHLSDVNSMVLDSPHLAALQVPLPDETARADYIAYLCRQHPDVTMGMPAERLAEITAGLTCIQMGAIFQEAKQSGTGVSFDLVRSRKKQIIEKECVGLVEFVEPEHDLSMVGGLDQVKDALRNIAGNIREGNRKRVPMGVMFVGPMGTGKTYMAEAFAKESGLTCLKLANFRDKWVGSTESNLEKIITVVNAMGFVLVIIDEGDRSIGGGHEDLDGGTSSRVTAKLKEFMSDTSHRGRIVFVMMTNRPDKLDTDMKRPGRFDQKIPFFAPQTAEARQEILQVLYRKNGIRHSVEDFAEAAKRTEGYTGADLEAVILLSDHFCASAAPKRKLVRDEDLLAAIDDFIPSRDALMLEYMELLAVFECSSRSMLPERYRQLTTEELNLKLRALRAELGLR
jgi:SpoVK/Ycf46/Vps4 family AAA+-type ATPase